MLRSVHHCVHNVSLLVYNVTRVGQLVRERVGSCMSPYVLRLHYISALNDLVRRYGGNQEGGLVVVLHGSGAVVLRHHQRNYLLNLGCDRLLLYVLLRLSLIA